MIGIGLVLMGLAACESAPTPLADTSCPATRGGLADLTAAEVAFSRSAQTSVRNAFLAVLADDSIVLQPEPRSGRKVWTETPESADRLSWYPAAAELAASADLGFTTGPWTYTIAANGKQIHGSYVTVWRRAQGCDWRVVFDGGVSHGGDAAPELHPDPAAAAARWKGRGAAQTRTLEESIWAFHAAAVRQGLGAALPTHATSELRSYADKQLPMDAAASALYFAAHAPQGAWREALHALSADGSLAYAYGELAAADESRTAAYLEIWRYDPAERRYRIRLLLLNAYPQPRPQSG